MVRKQLIGAIGGMLLAAWVSLAAAAPPVPKQVDYLRDVKPILQSHCYACHGHGSRLGGFQIDTREGILKGGQTHPAVVPGHSERSLLIQLVSGTVPGKVMPARGPRLTTAQIDVLRAWIDQGLKFDAAGMAASWIPPLAPRRTQITGWLYTALATNMPYDRFVSQLVDPTPEAEGFTKGIVWRGTVNASQTPQMQAAQNVSQVFMGVNLKCASCHNSFINNWKLADSYGMAGIFADGPLEMVRCDRQTGEIAPIKFIYPELGSIDPHLPREKRQEQLAAILTSRANGRLARTLVNRLWGKLMGRGLVEPADQMDNRPWYPELLDWLAADFVDNSYDVRK